MGYLVNDKADLCASGLGMEINRVEAIDFSLGILSTPYTLMIKDLVSADSEAHLDYKSYLGIFSLKVWLSLVAFGILFAFCFWLSIHYCNTSEISYGGCFSIFCLSLMQKSYIFNFSTVSPTIVYWLMSLFGMVVYIAYTCDLTAKMTTGESNHFPSTFAQLVDEGYTIFVAKGGLPEVIMQQSPDEATKIALDHNVLLYDYPLDGDLEPIIEQVLAKPKQVFFGTTLDLSRDDRLKVLKGFKDGVVKFTNLAFQKNSDITGLFNFHLTKVVQSGVLDKIEQRWLREDKPTNDMSLRIFVEDSKPIGPKSMMFPGCFLAFSVILSMFCLLIEFCKKL